MDESDELGATGSRFLRRLKWAVLSSLVALVGLLQYARHQLHPFLESWQGQLTMDAAVLVASLFLFGWMFRVVTDLQERLERQNRELLALHHAGLDIYGELSLDAVLQKVVDQARQLLEARYGAVSVVDGLGNITQFVSSGVAAEQAQRIGSPPRGDGLLGVVLKEGQRLRLADVTSDPRSVGFPPHHPRMHSLLAVPILCTSPFRGNLYVAEKDTALEFSTADEESLVRFATAAGIALDNTYLHQRLRTLAVAEERVRIAREMHDGLAQVLAYVNTKAQAVGQFLQKGRQEQAAAQLEQLAAAAREVYTDVREGILALRVPLEPGGCQAALAEFVDHWRRQSGLAAQLEVATDVRLSPTQELQVLRIVQEALTNVRKHARAATGAWVRIEELDGRLAIEVRDDGRGFDPEARQRSDLPRFGLAIMRERAESIGATFRLDSTPGTGTRVRIELPKSQLLVSE